MKQLKKAQQTAATNPFKNPKVIGITVAVLTVIAMIWFVRSVWASRAVGRRQRSGGRHGWPGWRRAGRQRWPRRRSGAGTAGSGGSDGKSGRSSEERRKQFLDSTSAEGRAQFSEYRRMMNERRQELG